MIIPYRYVCRSLLFASAKSHPVNVLHIDSSPRFGESVSRQLTQALVDRLRQADGGAKVTRRDVVAEPLPFADHEMITAYYTPPAQLTDAQTAAVKLSNDIVAEVQAADVIVVGAPIWNFGVPASLKAWFDLVARIGLTFNYTETGPVGLLEGKKVYFAIASGGTPVDSPVDHTTPHLRTFFSFMGVTDQEVISADGIMGAGGEEKIAQAKEAAGNISLAAFAQGPPVATAAPAKTSFFGRLLGRIGLSAL